MLKKRLIFALLWKDARFCLSRNFKLQSAGDLAWINQHYNFKEIAFSIDELVVLNVSRGEKNIDQFAAETRELSRGCFVPLAVGGGVRSVGDAKKLLRAGADKIIVNTPLFDNPSFVRELGRSFGSQCVVASIDYKQGPGGPMVMKANGSLPVESSLVDVLRTAETLGVGEILLTSIDRDGTGQGYDLSTLERAATSCRVPVIASGGVGKFEHFDDWLSRPLALAACTANIFNFLGEGLVEARRHLAERGIPLASWDFRWKG